MSDIPYEERTHKGKTYGLQVHTVLIALRALAQRREQLRT